MTISVSTAPVASAISAIPVIPTTPIIPTAPVVSDIPTNQYIFGTGMAAIKKRDETEYRTLGRINMDYRYCGVLYWMEVIIIVKISAIVIIQLSFFILILIQLSL